MKHARHDYDRIQDPSGKIPADEPVFLIRGQDRVGAETVRYWAMLAAGFGASPEIVEMAERHANAMEAWTTKKVPDLQLELPLEPPS
jgi:hypothetical protein